MYIHDYYAFPFKTVTFGDFKTDGKKKITKLEFYITTKTDTHTYNDSHLLQTSSFPFTMYCVIK